MAATFFDAVRFFGIVWAYHLASGHDVDLGGNCRVIVTAQCGRTQAWQAANIIWRYDTPELRCTITALQISSKCRRLLHKVAQCRACAQQRAKSGVLSNVPHNTRVHTSNTNTYGQKLTRNQYWNRLIEGNGVGLDARCDEMTALPNKL